VESGRDEQTAHKPVRNLIGLLKTVMDKATKTGAGRGIHGEEDVDFEVAPISGKGVGLIAKRPIPIQFRILVEGFCSKDHPALQDLIN
jgi:hypothetical protein